LLFLVLSLPQYSVASEDVPTERADLTVEETQNQKKFNAKDPDKGFEGEDSEGAYYYEADKNINEKFVGDLEVVPKKENYDKGLKSVMNDGSYLFESENSSQSGSFSLRYGVYPAPEIKNEEGIEFSQIYPTKSFSLVFFEYSWEAQFLGKWGLTFGSGLGQTSAPGHFRSDPTQESLERYTLYFLPNHLSLSYRFQFTRSPYLVPYVTGGVCNYMIAEKRDDKPRFNGIFARGVQAAGGVKINIGGLDQSASESLEAEYGINNVWLDLELKIVTGAQVDRNISARVFNGGISFDF
jgi:hypothetical protein